MVSIAEKADHVRRESARNTTFDHHCHWPGCTINVPPAKWGCSHHWYSLPKFLRDKIWRAYRPGQEQSKDPSPAYVAVAREVQEWIGSRMPKEKPAPEQGGLDL